MLAIFHVRFSAMAGMDPGNEKQMSMIVATKVILRFSDLASAEKSVKKWTQIFFPSVKWACVLVNLFSMVFAITIFLCVRLLQKKVERPQKFSKMDSSKTNYDLLNKRGLELDSLMTKKIQRSCHNYLFIDPRLAILRSGDQSEEEKFETFLSSIFYVGQGKKSRPFQHLIDAKLKLNRYCNDLSSKIKKFTRYGTLPME